MIAEWSDGLPIRLMRKGGHKPTRKEEKMTYYYEVRYTDPRTGAISPIDWFKSPYDDLTPEDYIKDCEEYASEEWLKMLKAGKVTLAIVDN